MVQLDYSFTQQLPNRVLQQIGALPNLIGVQNNVNDYAHIFTFDHTEKQQDEFLTWLNQKMGINDVPLSQYTQLMDADWVYGTNVAGPVLTNIGSTFRNVYAVSDGLSFGIDIRRRKVLRLQVHWLKVGTGIQTVQIVQKGNPANVLCSLDVVSGENMGQIIPIPDIFWNTSNRYLIQAKSTVAGDDPQFLGLNLYMR